MNAMLHHAEQCWPHECCGVVAQRNRTERYITCRNLALNAQEQFYLCPEDYAAAEAWGTINAIVHSHPDATTQPSELDKAQCDATGLPWHIVSWPEGDIQTLLPRSEQPLIGRAFVLGHTDCWGLIMSWFRQQYAIELPDYRVDYPWWENGEDNRYMDNWQQCGFYEFTGPAQEGDVVIMQLQAPVTNHAGVLLSDNMLLHHLYCHLSQRTPYGGYWQERTLKKVRYHAFN